MNNFCEVKMVNNYTDVSPLPLGFVPTNPNNAQ